jgi:hypothetical protein
MNFDFENHYRVLQEQQKDHLRDNSRRKPDQNRIPEDNWKRQADPLHSPKNNQFQVRSCT